VIIKDTLISQFHPVTNIYVDNFVCKLNTVYQSVVCDQIKKHFTSLSRLKDTFSVCLKCDMWV
jgi:hypothetical protein